jgi:glyoxylase-like metal-dependent hydrolase (beta-lactamase superfamily II)
VLLAETNFERNAQELQSLIASVTPGRVELVVNTHWHGDHIGGNKFFAAGGAVIMAHENTRTRMMSDQVNPITRMVQLPKQAPEFLPHVTFRDSTTIHWDGETVDVVHYPQAHTDSDVALYYRNANVVFVGGLMEYPMYPGIQSADGFVAALDAVLARTNANTKVIPWQGPVVGPNELREFRTVLVAMRDNVARLIREGKTIEEIIAAKPSGQFDAKWGGGRTPERWARDMHYALTNPPR